jgi:hypothetical protein
MRFLADENFPGAGVAALRGLERDVLSIGEVSRGASDAAVLDLAAREGRIILTFDKDFGELARKSKLPDACGVILFRMSLPAPAAEVGERLAKLVAAREDWAGHFSVIEPGRVRMRRLR